MNATLVALAVAVPQGAQTADTWYAYVMNKLTYEHGLAAALGGLVLSWVVTQLIKHSFPLDWPDYKVVFRTRITAFVSGFVGVAMLWPITYELEKLNGRQVYAMVVVGLCVAIIVGGLSPTIYKIIVAVAYRRGWMRPETWSVVTRNEAKRMDLAQEKDPTENGVH